ncbi:MAG TPA: Hsp20 family protein, partial [Rhodopila sp.]|nr:Hsp20 family protein [Rhodopila sp.]
MMDFAPLTRSSIGFDRLFDMLEQTMQVEQADNYPPYNIEKVGEDAYRITLAVAGFTADELSVTSQQDQLIVAGRRAQNNGS